MALRFHLMQTKDVHECTEIIAAHPVIGQRYERGVKDLYNAWRSLIDSEAMIPTVFEEVTGTATRICGFGVGVFVSDDFMREVKTPPLFWFGAELAKRVATRSSPALSDKEVREANSKKGLNLIVWEAVLSPDCSQRQDVYHLMVDAFRNAYRGFLLNEMITSQLESLQRLQLAVDAGGLFWDPAKGRYGASPGRSNAAFIRKPHIVGITREIEFGRLGSWVGTLFDYQPPRFGFSRSEQRLLQASLSGETGTDQDLAKALAVSLPTIKKMWVSIYRRIGDGQPDADRDRARTAPEDRGKEKRRRLLAYVREHPEELRPVSRKCLAQQSPAPKRIHGLQA